MIPLTINFITKTLIRPEPEVRNDFWDSYSYHTNKKLTKDEKKMILSRGFMYKISYEYYSELSIRDYDLLTVNYENGHSWVSYFMDSDYNYPDEPIMCTATVDGLYCYSGFYRYLGAKYKKKDLDIYIIF